MASTVRIPAASVATAGGDEPSTGARVTPPVTVRDRLFEDAAAFEFFQAVRLLERMQPRRLPVGRHQHPRNEVVRFKARPSLTFPASEIHDLLAVKEGPSPWTIAMVVNFMGLYGPQGVLPQHYTERIVELDDHTEERARRTGALRRNRRLPSALRAFLDLFNHRFISLFYRAWEKYRFPIAFERGDRDRFSDSIRAFVGIGTAGLNSRLGIPDHTLLYYGGLLAKRPRSAVALEAVLQDHFGVPVKVQQFRGSWFRLENDSRTQLALGGRNQLGVDAGLWERFWDPQVRFRVTLGPLSLAQYRAFLPSGGTHKPLVQFTRFFAGEEFGFDVQLVLNKDEVPPCQIGGDTPASLGWSAWLGSMTMARDPDDAVFVGREAELAEQAGH